MPSTIERRLAAIVAADVVGYSRLMGLDELATLKALKSARIQVINPAVSESHGRLVKTTGDGLLLEFASVVDAISCAVAIQKGMLAFNAAVPADRRIVFRIGINIGDIIIDGQDIFGDGVNVAARLEGLCEPGGICVSRAANEQVRDKLRLSFADLGEHFVKNIARAIGVFGLSAADIAALPDIGIRESSEKADPPRGRLAGASGLFGTRSLLLALVLIAIVALAWILYREHSAGAPVPDLASTLFSILEKGAPNRSPTELKDAATSYIGLHMHRAMAIAPKAKGHWRTGSWSSREIAEEKVLEKCLQFYDEPCAVVASDDTLLPPKRDGVWFTQDAPRVRYSGAFNPERIPAVRPQALARPDISGYPTIAGPKAAAFNAEGIFTLTSGSQNQHSAEEQALRDCNADPIRNRSGGPCYLYAIENRVVLPLRLTAPMTRPSTPPATAAQVPSTSSPAGASTTFLSILLAEMEKIAPAMPERIRLSEGSLYVSSGADKAIAMHPPYDTWRTALWPSEALAKQNSLEACEVRHGDPCVLLAVNDRIEQRLAGGEWPKQPMPRVHYAGLFEPQQIPALKNEVRGRRDVVTYRSTSGNKAAALHPWGRMFIVTGTESQFSAEVKALSDCNEDASRNGRDGPCWLYAVSDQVVLTQRSRFPLSPKD
ncbi:MAG TPA: adenylate/guanylate cyclase domain-containing protein [Bradyrhizobium sp.]